MQTKALVRYVLPTLFAAAMLLAQNAHAGWIVEWIKCSERCGWICDCDGGELALEPRDPQEKKAAEEIMKAMEAFKLKIRSLGPDAKKLLKRVDTGPTKVDR
ncbi:MAG: hypothetical protein HY815_26595 [Candidatus Riflebacteria bacterium]|nr:hypothetical protein [Candidatus Riflebacteria bacterium]